MVIIFPDLDYLSRSVLPVIFLTDRRIDEQSIRLIMFYPGIYGNLIKTELIVQVCEIIVFCESPMSHFFYTSTFAWALT